MNPEDISTMIFKYLYEEWRFDYFYDDKSDSDATRTHGIYNNGKTVKCNITSGLCGSCICFYRV